MAMFQFMEHILSYFRANGVRSGSISRDPRYVVIALLGFIALVLSTIQAGDVGTLDSIEKPLFNFVNNMPTFLLPFLFLITQLGSFFSLIFWSALAYALGKLRLLISVLTSGLLAWIVAKFMKSIIGRGRPGEFIENIISLSSEVFSGNGFPSGHSALVAACVFALYYHIDRRYRKYFIWIIILVGFSRIYIGAHFPMDVVGGWALGMFIAAIVSLAIGTGQSQISYGKLRRKLAMYGYEATSINKMKVDARGSTPFKITTESDEVLFAKVFGQQEYAADWLFKSIRFLRFKSSVNEEVYVSSKRNIEIEALGGLWAKNAGVNTTDTLVMFPLGSKWVLVQKFLDAKPLSSYKTVRTDILDSLWKQVKLLHAANISHRDLRTDNIMVDTDSNAYIIDFGFAEIAPSPVRKRIDIAQLLISVSLIAGTKRTVQTAIKHIDKELLTKSLPYLQKAILPAATNKSLKLHPNLLNELRMTLRESLGIKEKLETADVYRMNLKKLISVLLFTVLLYVLIPQLDEFRGALQQLVGIEYWWLTLIISTSLATYGFAALVIYMLTSSPLHLGRLTLIQLASSFVSKIVPGGVGSAALNIRFLKKSGFTIGEASGVMAAERTIGFLGLVTLLVIFSIFGSIGSNSLFSFSVTRLQIGSVLAIAAICAIVFRYKKSWRKNLLNTIKDAYYQLRNLLDSPVDVLLAYASGLMVTIMYVLCLYASLKAVGVTLSILQVLIVYVTSIIAKGVSPTPGGLGALEVAMAAALQGFGIAGATTYAAVVLYRIATYWLPLPIGIIAYRYASARNYF